jgi:3-hydroxymyristoyl/3-hydroxydecanoyl-(acyl carrier protein) dehydratase
LSKISQHYCIDSTHPSLAGHFPHNPIVPGVVILDYASNLVQEWQPGCRITGLTQAKFLKPLHPGQQFTIKLIQASPSLIKFECDSAEEKLVTGTFVIECSYD